MTARSMAVVALLLGTLAPSANAQIFRIRDRNRGRDLEEMIGDRPSPPEVLEARAKADTAYQQRDYNKVIEVTNWLIENHPTDNSHFAYHLRASAKVELGKASGSAKQVREGISDARTAIGTSGAKYPWLHIPYLYGLTALAEIERRPEHAALAITAISPVLKSYPVTKEYTEDDRANLFYQRGLAYAVKGDFKLAADDYSEAIKLSPGHLGAYIKRAEAFAALGQTKEALAAYDNAVEEFPATLLVFNDRGNFRRRVGDLEGAVGDFTRCLTIDPKFAVGYINRGMCLSEQNDPQAAEGDFSEALKLKLDPGTSVLARRLRAVARLSQGNAAAAITDFDAAVKASPQDAALYEERGFANYFRKDFAAALADYSKALKLRPQATYLLPWQVLAQTRAGQAAEARTLLATTLEGKNPPTGWTAVLCNFLLDKTSEQELLEAAAAAGNAREKNQHLCEAHFFAGQKQLLREDADAAAGHFRETVGSKEYALSAFRGARYELGDFK
jgi:lipoprotein NlpI